jgi:hypothetical protein
MHQWTAYIGLHADDVEPIRQAALNTLPSDRYAVVTEVLPDGSDGEVQLALDVEATSLTGAMELAEAEWQRLCLWARLSPSPFMLDFLVGPIDAPATLFDVLLGRARALLAEGQPTYAVVAAQTAFELYMRGRLRDLSRATMPLGIAEAIQPRRATLRDAHSAKFFQALLGRPITDAGDAWIRYDAHSRLRNGIVHEGAEANAGQAQSSIKAVADLMAWVETETGPM